MTAERSATRWHKSLLAFDLRKVIPGFDQHLVALLLLALLELVGAEPARE